MKEKASKVWVTIKKKTKKPTKKISMTNSFSIFKWFANAFSFSMRLKKFKYKKKHPKKNRVPLNSIWWQKVKYYAATCHIEFSSFLSLLFSAFFAFKWMVVAHIKWKEKKRPSANFYRAEESLNIKKPGTRQKYQQQLPIISIYVCQQIARITYVIEVP